MPIMSWVAATGFDKRRVRAMLALMALPLTIDVISDVVCPWCFIGKRRLDAAVAGQGDIEVTYRPYRLDPSLPPEGMARTEYMRAKFGDAPLTSMERRLIETGDELGIKFAFDKIARSPNTLDCHRLILWAASAGVQDAVVEDLFSRYFEQGADVSELAVLADVARNAGLDPEQVLELLQGDDDRDYIESEDERARRMGIEGVPCYIVAGRYALMGAQDPAVLHQVFARAREENALLAANN
ncbi:MAG TPA: DsbA family oxidoreductase [Alphaproteobacteria bacterium]|nr:DsbA family oxidoreductase [Alphaproteobacteria bacterium]